MPPKRSTVRATAAWTDSRSVTSHSTWWAAEPIRSAPAVTEAPKPAASAFVPGDDPVIDRINQVLDEKVRPGLAGDGGGLEIVGYHDHRLMIHYQGACGSCPSSISGTLYAIEHMLREEVDPEIEVVSV